MQRLILSSATSLLACSRPAASYLFGDGIDADPRFRFFPNAIDPACYLGAGLTEDAEEIFPREDAPSFVVGHVGSFRPAKNHKFLLQVFAALLRRIPHARLLLVGGGSGLGAARALAVALGVEHAVRFLGPRPDVPRLLRQMDLLLLPSLYEGMPTVLIEAQATGIPCVVSASVTREADLGLGLLRYLCLTESTETWADQCLHAIDTRRPTDLARLQAVRDSGYDIRQAAARLEGLYV
jgi:glycosyltransferase EpsF